MQFIQFIRNALSTQRPANLLSAARRTAPLPQTSAALTFHHKTWRGPIKPHIPYPNPANPGLKTNTGKPGTSRGSWVVDAAPGDQLMIIPLNKSPCDPILIKTGGLRRQVIQRGATGVKVLVSDLFFFFNIRSFCCKYLNLDGHVITLWLKKMDFPPKICWIDYCLMISRMIIRCLKYWTEIFVFID